jgi:hypothetical protein
LSGKNEKAIPRALRKEELLVRYLDIVEVLVVSITYGTASQSATLLAASRCLCYMPPFDMIRGND